MSLKRSFRADSLVPLEDRLVLSNSAQHVTALVASMTPGGTATTVRASRQDTIRFEVDFLKGMIPHHQMAIRMAQIEVRNGSDPAVVGLARRIIAEQTPELHRMQSWLYSGFGIRNFRSGMSADDMKMLGDLNALKGTNLDRAFLTDMIDHHKRAISGDGMMPGASDCLDKAVHSSLRQLCTNIVTSQSGEIREMQTDLSRLGGMPTGVGMGG